MTRKAAPQSLGFDPADLDALIRREPEIEAFIRNKAEERAGRAQVVAGLRTGFGLRLTTAKALVEKYWPGRATLAEAS